MSNVEIMNNKDNNSKKIFWIILLISLGIFYRMIPHPPNFSPLYSISVFSSFLPIEFQNKLNNNRFWKYFSFFIPLIILFLTDLILGFYKGMIFNYFAFISFSVISYFTFVKLKKMSRVLLGLILSIFSAIYFFIISNFGVWLLSGMYSKDLTGLILCYVNAIPFLGNSILSAIVFSLIIFYSYELVINLGGNKVKNVELN